MRKLSADYIFTGVFEPIPNGTITVDQEGKIIDVSSGKIDGNTEVFEGIICPGFINTHCHLELSHMRGLLQEKTGMASFIKGILSKRGLTSSDEIQKALIAAEKQMIDNGIVAVGDISNTNDTFLQKAKGNLYYHTFIEVFNPNPEKALAIFESGVKLEQEIETSRQNKSRASLVPHAPYTMSTALLKLIDAYALKNEKIISIHNQESPGEDELFISKSGPLFDLFKELGFDTSFFRQTGVNALHSTLPHIAAAPRILLVHNTLTSKEDIVWAEGSVNKASQLYWCTCPNANLYIENRLPNYVPFIDANCKVTIGTDSLASNWSLSVLDELKTIATHNPSIPLQTLLTWATKNGAEFLGIDSLGTIEKGKQPGLNLLTNTEGFKISDKTEVVKLT